MDSTNLIVYRSRLLFTHLKVEQKSLRAYKCLLRILTLSPFYRHGTETCPKSPRKLMAEQALEHMGLVGPIKVTRHDCQDRQQAYELV